MVLWTTRFYSCFDLVEMVKLLPTLLLFSMTISSNAFASASEDLSREAPLEQASTTQPSTSAAAKPTDREELTALKALDVLLRKYDRRSTPTNDLGVPTNVSCQLFVASLSSINTEDMDYVADTYLRQRWSDPRLSHEDIKSPLDLADPNLVKGIWKPEVFFPNAKEANFQFVTVPNVLIRIHPNGDILYILRLRLKFSCMMELSRYPLDTQVCAMQISSFSKTTKELLLAWDTGTDQNPVTVALDLKMPQFEMKKITTSKCHETNHMGNYSCLVAEFHLHRSIGFHLIQSYLPSTLIVAVSWVSFWMDVDCVPARVTLGVITLLTVSSQVSGSSLPQTSYVKAIDVWMGVCTAFVFAALVEFTLVNYLWRWTSGSESNEEVRLKGKVAGSPLDPQRSGLRQRQNRQKMDKNVDGRGDWAQCFPCISSQQSDIEMDKVESMEAGEEDPDSGRADHDGGSIPNSQANGSKGQKNSGEEIGAFAGLTLATGLSHKGLMGLSGAPCRYPQRRRATRIDEVCRFLFPFGFFIFNLIYWNHYKEEEPAGNAILG